jgi:S1-C subfamily serine protease
VAKRAAIERGLKRSRTAFDPLIAKITLSKFLRRILVGTALALSLFTVRAALATDIPELVARAKPAVVQIMAHDEVSQCTHLGTGWFVGDGKVGSDEVVTNFHVIAGASLDRIYAKTASGELLKLKNLDFWAFDPDLAEFTLTPATVSDYSPYVVWPSLPVGDSSAAREGDRVLVIGNPEGLYGTVSDGIISAFRDNGNIIQITAPISPGSSGSPVLNEKGEVIGIATYYGKEGQNLNFALSSDALGILATEHVAFPISDQVSGLNKVPAKKADLRNIESSLNMAYGNLRKLLSRQQKILLAEDQALWLITRPLRTTANSSAFYEMTRRRADEFLKLSKKYSRH